MALTGKKLAFAKALLAGKSNKEAAIKAGYSEKTASPAGSRLAKDPAVQAYLAIAKKQQTVKPRATPKKAAGAVARSDGPDEDPGPDIFEDHDDPKTWLLAAMKNPLLDPRQRIDAAKAALPYCHQKLGEGGKKEQKQDAAKKAAGGKFATSAPPKLVVNNKK